MSGLDSAAIDELQALGQRFVGWRWETRNGKPTKPPIDPHTGAYANTTDPATWADLGTAMAAVERYQLDGVGFVLNADIDGIVGADLDSCRDRATGVIADRAARIIRSLRSYAEVSPSGSGVKILCRADPVPKLAANKRTMGKANGAKAPAVEVYTTGRYFCLTGQMVEGAPDEIVDATPELEQLAAWIAKVKPTPELPTAFVAMLERDAQLREAWHSGAKIGQGGDTSASGLDWSLAYFLRPHLDDTDLEAVLRAYRHGQLGSGRLKGAAADRRLARILAGIGPRPSGEAHDNPDEWPGPPDPSIARPHRLAAPPLPLHLFGEAWAAWIAEAAEAKGCPPDFVALPLVAVTGAMVANARRASPWPGWVEPPIIWQASVGLPSSGKSPGYDAVIELVALLERELDGDYEERRRTTAFAAETVKAKRALWEKDVALAVKKGMAPPEPPREIDPPAAPARRRLLTSNSTIEQLAHLVAANDRGLILFRDELAGWVGQMDKYGGNGADRAAYIEAYGGRACIIDRVKDGASLRVPYFSVAIIGGIQPDRLASMLLAGDDDGLCARFAFVWPEAQRPTRPRRAPDNLSALGALRWLLTLAPEEQEGIKGPRVLPFEPTAADHLHAWRLAVADMEGVAAGVFLSWLGKLPGLAVRLALTFELLWWSRRTIGFDQPEAVTIDAVDAAIRLIRDYCLPMARRTFGEAALPRADRDAAALARWLLGQETMPDVVNARDLRHADALPTREADRYDAALAELTLANWVKPAPRKSGPGRTRKDFLTNPALRARTDA